MLTTCDSLICPYTHPFTHPIRCSSHAHHMFITLSDIPLHTLSYPLSHAHHMLTTLSDIPLHTPCHTLYHMLITCGSNTISHSLIYPHTRPLALSNISSHTPSHILQYTLTFSNKRSHAPSHSPTNLTHTHILQQTLTCSFTHSPIYPHILQLTLTCLLKHLLNIGDGTLARNALKLLEKSGFAPSASDYLSWSHACLGCDDVMGSVDALVIAHRQVSLVYLNVPSDKPSHTFSKHAQPLIHAHPLIHIPSNLRTPSISLTLYAHSLQHAYDHQLPCRRASTSCFLTVARARAVIPIATTLPD